MHTLAQRLRALEARVADIEGGYGETSYHLRRDAVRTRITLGRIAENMGIPVATDEEIDAALDEG